MSHETNIACLDLKVVAMKIRDIALGSTRRCIVLEPSRIREANLGDSFWRVSAVASLNR